MKLLILIPSILLCGCFRVVTQEQIDIAAQSNADAKAAAMYVEETSTAPGIKAAGSAATSHIDNISKALEIPEEAKPRPRVSKYDWKRDWRKASEDTSENLAQDNMTMSKMLTVTVLATMLAGIGLKLGSDALGTTPFGPVFNMVSMLFGHSSSTKRSANRKILEAMEEYKELDPKWADNKLYQMLSSRMTTAEKDNIKVQRDGLA